MRILLTGHAGYIGGVMAPILIGAGHDVVGLDIGLYRDCTFGDVGPEIPALDMDIRDVRRTDLMGFDAVIHLAGLSNDPLGDLDPEITYEINHLASVHLAETAKRAGVGRFLFSSSCSTYGAAGDQPIDERAEFRPVTPYGRSKVLAERDISRLADANFTPVFLRSSTAYGVSPRLRFDLVLNNLVAWAVTTGQVYLKSDGSPWRPVVHIEDISRAFLAALEAPRDAVHNQAFNVGSTEENYRISELATIVSQTVPDCEVRYAPDAGPDKRCYRVDCDKIRTTLEKFRPTWTARAGAWQLYQAFRNSDLSEDEFEGPRYKRIAHIKKLQADGLLDRHLRWAGARALEVPEYAQR